MRTIESILSLVSSRKNLYKDKELADFLGVSASTLSTWRKRGSIPYEIFIRVCVEEGWDFLELVEGTPSKCFRGEESSPTDLVNAVSVPVYAEVSAAAGHGAVNHVETPTSFLMVPVEFLPHGRGGDYKVIFVRGDSMEPTIQPRDPIIIDFGVRTMIGTGIYILRIDGELFVKRLDKFPDGSIRVSSDNRFYEPFTITPGSGIQLDIVGKVVLGLKFM